MRKIKKPLEIPQNIVYNINSVLKAEVNRFGIGFPIPTGESDMIGLSVHLFNKFFSEGYGIFALKMRF